MASKRPDRLRLLHGVTVAEIGSGIAGSFATAVLAQYGASVTAFRRAGSLVPAAGPRRLARGITAEPILGSLLDRSKTLIPVEQIDLTSSDVGSSLSDADVVIVDLQDPDLEARLAHLEDYLEEVSQLNRSTWVSISAFGLDGPNVTYRGSELICGAAGGMLANVRAEGTAQPIKFAGLQALMTAGQFAALASLHGLDRARRAGPNHIDVSAQEAVIASGPATHCAVALLNAHTPSGPGRTGPPSGRYPCKDGLVHINILEDHQWWSVVKAMEFGDWAQELTSMGDRIAQADKINEHARAWTRARSKVECADELQRFGVPASPVNTPADLLSAPQAIYRDLFTPVEIAGKSTLVPGLPFTANLGSERSASRTELSGTIQGLRVVEFTHVIAAPLGGSLIGAMGADVIRVENRERLDVYRRTPPYADDIAGVNRNCYFIVNNHSKRAIAFDQEPNEHQVTELLDRAQVVVENWGRRARRLGVDSVGVMQQHDGKLALSSSGFGADGPMGEHRAYAYNVQAFGGLTALTTDAAGGLVNMRTAWADLSTAVVLATTIAAWALGPERGRSLSVDLAMSEVVAARLCDYVAASQLPEMDDCHANEVYPFSPNDVYSVRDGQWLAVAVHSDSEWQAFLHVLDEPASLKDEKFATVEGRWENRNRLNQLVAELLASADAFDLFHSLQTSGVRCSPVLDEEGLIKDPHLAERGFFVQMNHPELGRRQMVGLPWRFIGEPRIAIGTPPVI